MSREYTVTNWQAWENEDGLVRDAHGNFKGTVWFEEDTRQADATFKTEPTVGDKKFGDLLDYQTKAGKTRLKFQRAERPQEDNHGNSDGNSGGYKGYVPRTDHHEEIKAQWAIGQAVQLLIPTINGPTEAKAETEVEKWATKFYAMVERVKSPHPELQANIDEKVQISMTTGYNNFQKSKPTAQNPDPEFASMMARGFEADDIKLEDIPF